MNDFLLKLRPKYPLSITPPTQTPIGVTIRTISGVSVIETVPNVRVQIKDEVFLAIAVSDWITTGSTIFLRAFSWTKPVVEITCHPNPALAAGFIFEIIPLRSPSRIYLVEFPPLAAHAQGVIIHADLKDIFSRTEPFVAQFIASHGRLQPLPQTPTTTASRVARGIRTIRQFELEAQERLRETVEAPEITTDHGGSDDTEGPIN